VYSPDGKTIVLMDTQRVQLFDSKSGALQGKLDGLRSPGLPVFSDDGSRIALASTLIGDKHPVTIWDAGNLKKLHELEVLSDLQVSVALSGDGKRLATWGQSRGSDVEAGNTIQVWDTASGKELNKVKVEGLSYFRGGVALSPDGKELAVANSFGVDIWDVESGKSLHRLAARRNLTPLIRYSPDGKLLVAASGDGALHRWETPDYKRLGVTTGTGNITSVAFLPDKKVRVLSTTLLSLEVWEAPSGRRLTPQEVHTGTVTTLCFSADGKKLFSGGYDGVRVWDAASGKYERQVVARDPIYTAGYGPFLMAPDARTALAGGTAGQFSQLLDVATGEEIFNPGVSADPNTGMLAAFSADGTALAVGNPVATKTGRGLAVRIWDLAAGHERAVVKLDTSDRPALAISPDGKTVLTAVNTSMRAPGAGAEAELVLWDATKGKERWKVSRARQWATRMTFSPDGATVAIAGMGSPVLLDAATGRELRVFDAADSFQANCLLFSPDGRTLVAGGSKRVGMGTDVVYAVRLWETATGKMRVEFTGHRAAVTALAFARDGRTLASGGEDTTVLLWDLTGRLNAAVAAADKPKAADYDALWQDLGDGDGAKAYRLMQRLAAHPPVATALLKAKLAPV
jgi:WD40 repeat protein